MHICIDGRSISHPRRGGFKTYTENLVATLVDLPTDDEFTIVYDRPYHFSPVAGDRRFREVVIPARIKMVGQAYREQVAIPSHAQQYPCTLWHFPYNTAPIFGIDNYVLTLHDMTSFTHAARLAWSHPKSAMKELLLYYYPRLLIRRSVQRAQAVITVSSYARAQIIEVLNIPAEKIFVTPLAASSLFRPLSQSEKHAVRESLAKKYGLNKPFLLTAASSLLKNPQGVVKAYAQLPRKLQKEYDLVIVMAYERVSSVVKKLAQELGVANRTHFLIDIEPEKLLWLYNLAAVLIYPSFTESFGLPPLESMACGTPVVASNVTSLPEILGNAALLVPPEDMAVVADATTQVLTMPALAAELRERGLARSRQFSWMQTARQTLAVYQFAVNS